MGLTSWKTARSIAIVGVLSVPMADLGVAQEPVPGLGTWRLNVAQSKYSPGPTPKSGTVTFTAVGQGVKAVVDLVGTDGSKIHWEYTAPLDGKPAPVTGNPDGDMVMAKRTNPNTIETSYTLKGKPTTVNTRVVSADGKTLTVTSTGTNAQGQKVNNHQVFEKS
jgi:hypothetical protein